MNPVSFLRVIKFALRDIARNVWLSAATVSVLVLTLLSVNILVSINFLGRSALDAIRSKVDISVHFKPGIEDARVQSVKIALLSLPEVRDAVLIPPAEVLQQFSEMYGRDAAVLESLGEVGENPFGPTLVVKARDISGFPKILETLKEPAFTDLVEESDYDDRQEIITRIGSVAGRIEMFGLAASVVFFFITLLIVFNTIRVSIYARREEIGMMRLVGASDWFIRGPFYVQAVVWSLMAVAVSLVVIWPALHFSQPYLSRFFGGDSADLLGFYQADFLRVIGLQTAALALMAIVTTKAATARYLRV